jgi:hypothetical protein
MLKKYTIRGIIILAGIIIGFIYLLRSCLAKYDERSAMSGSAGSMQSVLYFEKGENKIVFSIVQFQKTISYSRSGGFVRKSVSTTYYVQTNNAITGEKIETKKVKHSSDVKNYPVTTLGKAGDNAWVFIGEPIAYNPFTLEKIADKKMIEEKNAVLRGKMPEARQYYDFNAATAELIITATDGTKYTVNTSSLAAIAINEEDIAKSPAEIKIAALSKEEKKLRELNEQAYNRFRELNKLYSEKKLSYKAYTDSTRDFDKKRDTIYAMQRRINEEINSLESQQYNYNDEMRRVESFKNSSKSYGSICTDGDTVNGKWYGLLAPSKLEKFYNRFRYNNVYEETSRNKLYTAAYSTIDAGKSSAYTKIEEPQKVNDAVYLQGGFLFNPETALPLHWQNNFIVCYKESVGNAGNIMLALVDTNGTSKWNTNTKLSSFTTWLYTGSSIIVFGTDNKELSSGEINVMNIINLQNGSMVTYDYFTDKVRK